MWRTFVGYAQKGINKEGGTATAATFMKVGAANGEATFASIVPITAEGDLSWGIDLQYLLQSGGSDDDNYYVWDGTTWLKDGYLDASEMQIPAGQGLWIGNTSGCEASIQSAGEVNTKLIPYPLNVSGGTLVGNAFPCQITFSNLIPVTTDDGGDLGWGIDLQYLLPGGGSDDDNYYVWDGTTWLKDGYLDASEMQIPAGQGMWIGNTSGCTATLQMVAPEL